MRDHGRRDEDANYRWGFRHVYNRDPSPNELARLRKLKTMVAPPQPAAAPVTRRVNRRSRHDLAER